MFLYLEIAFKKGWSMFFDKGAKVSDFMILRLITAFEKKLFSFITTSSLFVISVL